MLIKRGTWCQLAAISPILGRLGPVVHGSLLEGLFEGHPTTIWAMDMGPLAIWGSMGHAQLRPKIMSMRIAIGDPQLVEPALRAFTRLLKLGHWL